MTVKGQKNHYNVKLLRGYGVSICLKNNKVCLRGGSDVFTGEYDKEEWLVTQIPYERIMISGKGYVSTEVIKLLTEKNINIILTDTYGNLLTAMHQVMSSPTATNYRIAQYDTFRNPVKVAYLQKQLLKSKLESQIAFLQSILQISSLYIPSHFRIRRFSLTTVLGIIVGSKFEQRTLQQNSIHLRNDAGHVW